MHPSALSLFTFALVVASDAAASPGAPRAPPSAFVQVSGSAFVVDGVRTRFAGTNSLALAQFADAFERADVLQRAVAANLSLIRLWAFSDGPACAPAPNQNYFQCWNAATNSVERNETALALHLDAALVDAARAGVRVILTLVNNWPAYGGIAAYLDWRVRASAAGVAPPSAEPPHHDDFYVDATMRAWYRDWASAIVGRVNSISGVAYTDDPTIFAYELANEPACTNSSAAAPCVVDGTSPAMRAWIAEMAAHVKAVDGGRHLVSIGDEGFYGGNNTGGVPCPRGQWWCNGASGDWLGFLNIPGVDYASLHVYPDSSRMSEWSMGGEDAVAAAWIANHTSQAHAAGKPMLMAEFGHGAAGLEQHSKYALYTAAARDAGADGWAVWMIAGLDDEYYKPPAFPSWYGVGDAELQIYCLRDGDPAAPAAPPGGTPVDLGSCAVLAAAAGELAGF